MFPLQLLAVTVDQVEKLHDFFKKLKVLAV
jgi:hypothetical protein